MYKRISLIKFSLNSYLFPFLFQILLHFQFKERIIHHTPLQKNQRTILTTHPQNLFPKFSLRPNYAQIQESSSNNMWSSISFNVHFNRSSIYTRINHHPSALHQNINIGAEVTELRLFRANSRKRRKLTNSLAWSARVITKKIRLGPKVPADDDPPSWIEFQWIVVRGGSCVSRPFLLAWRRYRKENRP